MSQRQVNIRLEEDDFKALEAVAFLDGIGVADQLRQVALQLVSERRADPDVLGVLEIWEKRARGDAVDSTVTRLPTNRGRRRA